MSCVIQKYVAHCHLQILPIVKGNDKHAILEAPISSNNNVWSRFKKHPLKTNMRLATAAAAQARGGILSQDEEEQLQYADMLIDVSKKSELNSLSSHRSGG